MACCRPKRPLPEPDLIQRSIGIFGRWHWWVVLWTSACKFSIAWHQLSIIFHTPPASYWCADTNISNPCSPNCTERVFNRSIFPETITTQWDLVCNKFQYANIVQFTTMGGILVGAIIFGVVSDRYGRRGPLIATVVIQAVSGCASAFVPWYWAHVVLRFICTTATGGMMITSFVLIMEIVGLKWRTRVGILYQLPFNCGHLTLPLIVYFMRDWRINQFFLSVTSVVLFVYYWVLPESPRWLLTVGKTDAAIKILERGARLNRLPTDRIQADVADFVATHPPTKKKGGNILSLFRTPSLRTKTLCIWFNWLVCGLCFFGMAQYIGELGGDKFVNVAISAAVQIPGTLISIWATEQLGRRITLISSNLIAGVSALLVVICPNDPQWLKAALGTSGMFGLSMSFPTVYIYAGELFPTIVRNIGCGTSSVFARVGSMSAPFVAHNDGAPEWLGPVIFGVVPIVGAFLCLFLPETANCKLPDTIEEAEAFGKKVKKSKDPVQETST